MKLWNDKYKPSSLEEIPHPQATSILKTAVENKRTLILSGPPGIGKSTLAHTLTKVGDYEILEVNASDVRNKDQIEKIIGGASEQMSLFNREKIILIDEIDGLSGKNDRGGVQAIAAILPKAKHAVIITTNDAYDSKLKSIKKLATIIDLNKVQNNHIRNILKKICEEENIDHSEEELNELILKASGDLRAAINDLQAHSAINNKIDLGELISRDAEESLLYVLTNIFKQNNIYKSMNALDRTDESLDEVFLWVDHNLPREYKKSEDLIKAYEKLALADVFRGRIRRQQYWRYLVYQRVLISAGITLSKSTYYPGFTKYERTRRLLKIWWANRRNAHKKAIAAKLAKKVHTSTKDILNNFSLYKRILKNEAITKELRLDAEQIDFIHSI